MVTGAKFFLSDAVASRKNEHSFSLSGDTIVRLLYYTVLPSKVKGWMGPLETPLYAGILLEPLVRACTLPWAFQALAPAGGPMAVGQGPGSAKGEYPKES
jgi:hypothetical protein